MAKKQLLLFLVLFGLLGATVVLAQEFTSTNFVDSNPVVTMGGGKSTSTNIQLFSGAGQTVIGESSSTAFTSLAGFFYFPFVSTPVISATAGDAQVSLSWTSAVGELGFNISAYSFGKSTNSGGPYSFTNVGNNLSGTASGLTNGTLYYFVVRALDFLGDPVATSSEVSATPVAAPSSPATGGGGTPVPVPGTVVIFSGLAYPNSVVTLLKDAQIVATTIADVDANFQLVASGLSGGNYIFSVYAQDNKGLLSPLLNFPINTTLNATTRVNGVLVPPTIAVDKSEVKRGDNVAISGQSVPQSEVNIVVGSSKDFFVKTIADRGGNYLYNFDTAPLVIGDYFAKAKTLFNGEISIFGKSVDFRVGTKNIEAEPISKCPIKADLNGDCRVNLVDVSILIYWFDKANPPAKVDFDGSGIIDLTDLSIMAYYWTG
jgi:hypothetical protein